MRLSLLYDFYGELLSARQKDVLRLYHEENFSLSEIADEYGISRQAVHDALKNGQAALDDYEDKLRLVARFDQTERLIGDLSRRIRAVAASQEGTQTAALQEGTQTAALQEGGDDAASPRGDRVARELERIASELETLQFERNEDGI